MNPNERGSRPGRNANPRLPEYRDQRFGENTATKRPSQVARRAALRSAIVADEIKRLVDRAGGRS